MTLKEIAAQTGYSLATVSRVLNGTGRYNEFTQAYQEITQFARVNGYSRTRRHSKLVAHIVPDIANPITLAITKTIQEICTSMGLTLIVVNTNENPGEEAAALQHISRLDLFGAIYSPVSEVESVDFVGYRAGRQNERIPVVLIGRELNFATYDSVYINNMAGAFSATRFLLQRGYRDIAAIAGPLNTKPGRERLEGFHKAFEYFGVRPPDQRILYGDFTTESGYRQTCALLRSGTLPQAIFPMNNLMTRGCFKALKEANVPIGFGGNEVALISFDGDEMIEAMGVCLPYVQRPVSELGHIAMDLLVARVQSEKANAPIQRIELNPTLYIPKDLPERSFP